MEALYIEAMDELLAKDLAFFHNNYAGSLTKRALGYARRFEDVFDVLAFQVAPTLLPLGFVAVVLWTYSPWLVVVLLGMLTATLRHGVPAHPPAAAARGRPRGRVERARRPRRRLDRQRRSGAGVRARAGRGAHPRGQRRRLRRQDAALLGLPEPARRPRHVADVRRHQHARARSWRSASSGGSGASLEAVFITFSYYSTATRVMWEFNRVYRNLEGALTDAAQFAELLLEPPAVVDATRSAAFTPADSSVELRDVSFRYSAGAAAALRRLSLGIAPGTKIGLVGRSGGGKTTLTRLLLRFSDVEAGAILVGGQPIDRVPQAALRQGDRLRAAGSVDVPPQHRRQHPRRPARTRPTRRSGARRSSPTRPNSSKRCRPATRRSSASAA